MRGLQPNERVLLKIHKHWLIFGVRSISLLILAVVPIVIFVGIYFLAPEVVAIFGSNKYIALTMFLASAWLLIVQMIFYIALTNYFLDTIVITDKRVIDMEQVGLFARDVTYAPIDNVQDVKVEVMGIIQTFLRYGTVHIQTAGEQRELVVRGIRHPERIRDTVLRLHSKTNSL